MEKKKEKRKWRTVVGSVAAAAVVVTPVLGEFGVIPPDAVQSVLLVVRALLVPGAPGL